MEHAGVDATDSFEEIGHSDDARKLLKDFLVGTIVGTKTGKDEVMTKKPNSAPPPPNNQGMLVAMVPIVAIISFIAYKQIYG